MTLLADVVMVVIVQENGVSVQWMEVRNRGTEIGGAVVMVT